MRIWAYSLRAVGGLYFGWAVLGQSWSMSPRAIAGNLLQAAILASMCFGLAAGLLVLERIEARQERHHEALRHLLRTSTPAKGAKRDLAPVAPENWHDFKPRPVDPVREKDSDYEQRLARRWRHRARPRDLMR